MPTSLQDEFEAVYYNTCKKKKKRFGKVRLETNSQGLV